MIYDFRFMIWAAGRSVFKAVEVYHLILSENLGRDKTRRVYRNVAGGSTPGLKFDMHARRRCAGQFPPPLPGWIPLFVAIPGCYPGLRSGNPSGILRCMTESGEKEAAYA